jgi:hypothetical protein
MVKSATDVMQEIVFSAIIDAIMALKASSKGVPNTLLRDLNAIHANTTFADLPAELQASLTASVRAAFTRLLKEGYSVSSGQPAPARAAPQRSGPDGRPDRPRRPQPPGRRSDAEPGRPPRGGRPDRKPRPPRG